MATGDSVLHLIIRKKWDTGDGSKDSGELLKSYEVEAFQIEEIVDSRGNATTRKAVPANIYTSSTSSCCW